MFGFLKNLRKVTLPLEHRYELIARNELSASTSDFTPNPDGKSLIHYACLFDNLELLKKCLATQSVKTTLDYHKRPALDCAFEGQSLEVLSYLVKEFNMDISALFDGYNQPLWWEGFGYGVYSWVEKKQVKVWDSFNYKNYINFLVNHKVDLNQRGSLLFDSNLAYKLLSGYKHKALYYLVESGLVDVNAISRTDCGGTLAHWCGYMEDGRSSAFNKDKDSYIDRAYGSILKRADLSLKNKQNEDVVESFCKIGYRYALNILTKYHPVKLTNQQKLWLNRYNLKEVLANPENVEKIGELVFYKIKDIDENLFSLEGSPLIVGLDDKEIQKSKVISLKKMSELKKVDIPSYQPVFYNH